MINDDILAHARQCAPAESCGYVVRTAQGERYFPCENLSAESGGCAARRRADLLFWFTDAQSCGDLLRQR